MKLFTNDAEAVFVSRPNRFVITAELNGKKVRCHCPNPGRMTECLFPGVPLILEKRSESMAEAKTQWTAAALRYKGNIVPLFASRANKAAKELVLPNIIVNVREIQGEFTVGSSRFDFLCIDGEGRRHLVEVKACSLVEQGVAMFPDAPSERALKHLEELAALSKEGYIPHIVFVTVHGKPRVFIPNLHTDPAFAAGLSRYSDSVYCHAPLIKCRADGRASLVSASIPIDLSHGELAESDKGSYFIIIRFDKDRRISVASLGELFFKKGYYIYCGSAQKNLSHRIARHKRKTHKRKHWHIDYLTPFAGKIEAFAVASYRNLECEMAAAMKKSGGEGIPGFGSSDCTCESHLFYFPANPLQNTRFVETLFRFRHSVFSGRDGRRTPQETQGPQ